MKQSVLIALTTAGLVLIPATCLAASATNAPKATKTSQQTLHRTWHPETLSGKITMVDPALKLVVLQDPSGVPFDIVVNRSTHIKSANGSLSLKDLSSDVNRDASIKFIPESRGDIAETINVSQ
jgi:hypothetical protein